jgi:hypothetical protein
MFKNRVTGEVITGYDYNTRMAREVVDRIKNLTAFCDWVENVTTCGITTEDDPDLFAYWVNCCKNDVATFVATEWEQIVR